MRDYDSKVNEPLPQAIEIAKSEKAKGNNFFISVLQRRLRIGYILGAMIADKMEEAGYIGSFDGGNGRKIYL